MFEQSPRSQRVRIGIEAVSLDSTMVKVHLDGTGALTKTPQSHGKPVGREALHQAGILSVAHTGSSSVVLSTIQVEGREMVTGVQNLPFLRLSPAKMSILLASGPGMDIACYRAKVMNGAST